MKLLFSFLKPQIVFGAGGGGGGSRGPAIKPTGFADQASRMANSQRQLGSQQMPGFNLEDEKDVPSVVKRKPQRDSSPIDAGSGGFMGSFNKSPKPNKQNGYKFKNNGSRINPITGAKEVQSVVIDPDGDMTKTEYGGKFGDKDQRDIIMHKGLAASTGKARNIKTSSGTLGILPDGSTTKGGIEYDGKGNSYSSSTGDRLDLSGIRGVANPSTSKPQFESQGTSKPVGLPRIPSVVADDFIPRNSDGSPKYTAPDGSPLRRPYDPSTPSRPTPRPGGGKGGGGIALPPNIPTPFPDPRRRPPTAPIPDPRPVMPTPQPRPVMPTPPADPRPGAPVFDNFPVTPFPDPRRRPPTAPIPDRRMPDPIPPRPNLYGGGKGGAGPRPSRPSAPVPPQPIREFGVPRQGGRPSVPTNDLVVRRPMQGDPRQLNDLVAQRPMPVRQQSPVPYGGKGGGARNPMQQRRPQAPFTYYRPKR